MSRRERGPAASRCRRWALNCWRRLAGTAVEGGAATAAAARTVRVDAIRCRFRGAAAAGSDSVTALCVARARCEGHRGRDRAREDALAGPRLLVGLARELLGHAARALAEAGVHEQPLGDRRGLHACTWGVRATRGREGGGGEAAGERTRTRAFPRRWKQSTSSWRSEHSGMD